MRLNFHRNRQNGYGGRESSTVILLPNPPTPRATATVSFSHFSTFGKISRRRRWNLVVFIVNTAGAVIYSTLRVPHLSKNKTTTKKTTHQNVVLLPRRDCHLFIYLRVVFFLLFHSQDFIVAAVLPNRVSGGEEVPNFSFTSPLHQRVSVWLLG